MKKILYILVLCCLAISCSDDFTQGSDTYLSLYPRYLSVSPKSLTIRAKQTEANKLTVTSEQTPWKLEYSIPWLRLSATSGSSNTDVNVVADENKEGDVARVGVINFMSTAEDFKYEETLSVTQSGATPTIELSQNYFRVSGTAHTVSVDITANCTWNVNYSAAWINATVHDNTITITTEVNTTNTERVAIVEVVHDGNTNVTKQITVYQTPATITASTTTLAFPNVASSATISIDSEAPWTASTSQSWVELSTTTGSSGSSTLKISVAPNTTLHTRNANVILSIGGFQRIVIPITQDGIYIHAQETNFSYASSGGSQTLHVESNTSWKVSSKPDWITLSQDAGTGNAELEVKAADNPNTTNREGVIHLTQDGLSIDVAIAVEQSGKFFNLSTTKLEFEDEASSQGIMIESDGQWTATTADEWISLSQTSGGGSGSVMVYVSENKTENQRKGNVIMTMSDKSYVVEVSQKGKVFSISTDETSLMFSAEGGTQDLNVECNTTWAVTSKPDWISITPTAGEKSQALKVTATGNLSTSSRSGNIAIRVEDGNEALTVNVEVYQAGLEFDVSTTQLTFDDKAATQTISIKTDGSWTATVSATWITLTPSSGMGECDMKVTVTENVTDAERVGFITIVMADQTAKIPVVQSGKYFTISNSQLTYPSTGGTIQVNISTNDSWTAEVEGDATWLTLSQTSGTGNLEVKIVAGDNPSVNSRSASVLFKTKNGKTVRVAVQQDARYLTVDTREILFYAKGGTSDPITVSTDGKFDISSTESWFSINRSGNTFTVTTIENKEKEPRVGTITIALTDLKEGTYALKLEVMQLSEGGTFILQGYEDDINWDAGGNGDEKHFTLEIIEFGDDTNWDSSNGGDSSKTISLTIIEYTTDQNWDDLSSNASKITVTITGFNEDINYDSESSDNSSGMITIEGYQGDKNYDFDDSNPTSGNITIDGYQNDKNYDTEESISVSGDISVEGHSGDKNYDGDDSSTTSGNITVEEYKDDTNYDTNDSSTTSGNITSEGYQDDKNYDTDHTTNSSGDITVEGYESDNNWE